MNYNKEIIKKFLETPGLCNSEELLYCKNFLNEVKLIYNMLMETFLHIPYEGELIHKIESVKWYEDFLNNKM